MIIERVYTDGLAQVAWLLGDVDSGQAVVIDPRRDPQIYVDIANDHGLRIVATLETHIHADFVSGVLELQKLTGADIYVARQGDYRFNHIPLDPGDILPFGGIRLRAYHTPGHTPEHLSYLLYTTSNDTEPVGIFTGDALFVGEVGRPDLLGEDEQERLLQQLYQSVTQKFASLPDHVTVYPGHGAGSACGKNISDEPTSTIGQERISNYAFHARSLDEFRGAVMTNMPPAPTYYPVLKRINQKGAPPFENAQTGGPVAPERIEQVLSEGGVVVDVRSPYEFAAGHIPGTMSIGEGSSFVDWMGWVAPYDKPLYFVLPSDDDYRNITTDLLRIGVDEIGGYLQGGVDAWTASGRELDSYPVVTVDELRDELSQRDDLQVVDVRSPDEWESGHIEGAHHAYLGSLIAGDTTLPQDGTLAFVCGSGYRANIGASVARLRGYQSVMNVDGGMSDWQEKNYPVVEEKSPAPGNDGQ